MKTIRIMLKHPYPKTLKHKVAMNKGLILSFLVFFLTTTLHSQTIDLFQLINTIDWHSTETDLIRNYPDDIQKQSHYSNNREQTMTDYIFDSVSIGKYVCKTDIWVDSLTKNLYSLKSYVSNCVDKSIEAEVLSNEMDRLLISVFGEPDIIDNDYGTYMSHLDRRWFKEKYIVDVNHMVFSTSQIYVLTIEKNKAEGNDFRVAKWGESKESIMRKEGKRDKANIAEIYLFDDFVAGMDCDVAYIFTDNKLCMAKYYFKPKHTNKNDYIKDFRDLVTLMKEKYGETSYDAPEWHNTLYKGDYNEYGFAVSLGHLSYSAGWLGQTSDIMVVLYGENYEINLMVQYVSEKYKQAMRKQQRKDKVKNL